MKNFIYKKISEKKLDELKKTFIEFTNIKTKSIQKCLRIVSKSKNKTPNGMLLPKKGDEKKFLKLQTLFYSIILNTKKFDLIKKKKLLCHFPITIRINSDKTERNYDSRIPHFDRWVGEPEGLYIVSLNLFKAKNGATLEILKKPKNISSPNKILERYKNNKLNKKMKSLYIQKVGELILMKDCFHRTLGKFGMRLTLEARFAENKLLEKYNKIKIDRLLGYLPINTVLNLNESKINFLNRKNGPRSLRPYPVDFSLKIN